MNAFFIQHFKMFYGMHTIQNSTFVVLILQLWN